MATLADRKAVVPIGNLVQNKREGSVKAGKMRRSIAAEFVDSSGIVSKLSHQHGASGESGSTAYMLVALLRVFRGSQADFIGADYAKGEMRAYAPRQFAPDGSLLLHDGKKFTPVPVPDQCDAATVPLHFYRNKLR